MPGPKTNEREGTRALVRHARVSAFKVRPVLDLIRNKPVDEAREILRFCERDAAMLVGKVLDSAAANAQHNDGIDPDELYVSACFADEGKTIKRMRPRARGRATTIRQRLAHVTIIVSRLPERELARRRARQQADLAARRRRVAAGRAGRAQGAEGREAGEEAGKRRFGRRRRDVEAAATFEEAEAEEAAAAEAAASAEGETTNEAVTGVPTEEALTEAVETAEAAGDVEATAPSAPDSDAADTTTTSADDDATKEEG